MILLTNDVINMNEIVGDNKNTKRYERWKTKYKTHVVVIGTNPRDVLYYFV